MGCSLRRFNRFYLFTTTVIMIAGGGATLEMWHVPTGGELVLLVR